jgi:hypothetical protein
MHSAELVRHDNSSGRSYYVLQLPNFESWPEQLPLASRHFALFIASDARQVPSTVIGEVALTAIKQGAVYVCAWGPGCEVVHDVFDEAKVELDLEKAEAPAATQSPHLVARSKSPPLT